uniref:Uncharacterized protein n=1 Tax=Populus trichocarpa TaxID=3694 RepID=A0A3N7EM07_POPTR
MHDSNWLIFAFSSKLEMLDILGGGPYFVFGRPLILKVMLEFFDFTTTIMMQMQMLIWVMYESLPRFCKQCRVLGHTTSTCNKGTGHKYVEPVKRQYLTRSKVLMAISLGQ